MKKNLVPNQYTPEEYRLLMPAVLDNQLTHSSLIVKKVIALYFAKDLPVSAKGFSKSLIDAKYTVKGAYMEIPVELLSERFQHKDSSSHRGDGRVRESFAHLLNEVNQSVKVARKSGKVIETEKDLQASILANQSNIIHITPEQEFKILGRPQVNPEDRWKGYKTTVLLEEVNISNGCLNVKVSSFLRDAREHRNRLLKESNTDSTDFVIIANYKDLLQFRSSAVLHLYYLIAKHQPITNYLIISVDNLCKELGIKAKQRKHQYRSIKAATSDPVLLKSTCALKGVTGRGKKDFNYFSVHKRDKSGIVEIRLDFNSNEENKAALLSKEYGFIAHIKKGLNESILLQIIARVADKVIDEAWVNYCVNEAYEANRRSSKAFENIGPLVWSYVKELRFLDIYRPMEQDCELSPEVGLSIREYREKTQPVQLNLSMQTNASNRAGASVWDYLRQQADLEEAIISYCTKNIPSEKISQALATKPKSITVSAFVRGMVMNHFKGNFIEVILEFLTKQLFIQRKHANLLHSYLDEDTLGMLFGYFDQAQEQIRVPASMKSTLAVQFKEQVASIIQNL